jgi:hypothetical protein
MFKNIYDKITKTKTPFDETCQVTGLNINARNAQENSLQPDCNLQPMMWIVQHLFPSMNQDASPLAKLVQVPRYHLMVITCSSLPLTTSTAAVACF